MAAALRRFVLPRGLTCRRRVYSTDSVPPFDCVRFEHVATALHRIRSGIVRTPMQQSHWLSEATGCHVHLKMEQQQFTGSFKERGARNALLNLSAEESKRGVVAASAGNHALALCWHGLQLGIPVTVVMPTVAPMAKVDKCRLFGANVVIHGAHIGEAKQHALDAHADLKYINGYDDPEIIAGTGTLGMEMLEQVPDCEVMVVPVGGAGLIAGIALAVKTMNPEVKVARPATQRASPPCSAPCVASAWSEPPRALLAESLPPLPAPHPHPHPLLSCASR